LRHAATHFCFIFWRGSHIFCLSLTLDHVLPTYDSCVPGLHHVPHHAQFVCWDGFLQTFCLGTTQIKVLLSSVSGVVEIIEMSQHAQPKHSSFWHL
jgi:hypothetical protein